MRKVIIQNMEKVKKIVPIIEEKIKIKISLGKGYVILKGDELNEFLSEEIISAVDFGFYVDDALLIKNQDFILEFIDIKKFTRRKNLKEVRARLIGKKGKAKKTIENLTGSIIVINNNKVGVIVDSAHLDVVTQAIESLVRGAKHGNVFAYLEKQNTSKQKFDKGDLGLKANIKNKNKLLK